MMAKDKQPEKSENVTEFVDGETYEVDLKHSIEIAGRTVNPGNKVTMSGRFAKQHKDKIRGARRITETAS
jgi:hypothetical protein